jgi:integrase
MTLIGDFLDIHASAIWGPRVDQTQQHLDDCKSKIEIFLGYDDNHSKHFGDIGTRQIMDFGQYLRLERGVSENTVNHYKAAISKLYAYAEEYGEIGEGVVPRIKFKRIKTQAPHFYSPEQITQIQEYLGGCRHSWMLHMFNIGLCTGMRRSEIWRVRRDDVVWIEGQMYVHLAHTKNGFARDVPISVEAKRAFDAVNWSFPTTRSGKFPEGAHRAAWNEIRRVICKGKKMANFHASRHTAASVLSNGMQTNLALVSELLGHKDMATTKKYIHVEYSNMSSIAQRLSSITVGSQS